MTAMDSKSKEAIEVIAGDAKLLRKMRRCLNWRLAAEKFENRLQQIMTSLQSLLARGDEAICGAGDDNKPSSIEKLQTWAF